MTWAAPALTLVAGLFSVLALLVKQRWPPLRHLDTTAGAVLHGYALSHRPFAAAMGALSTLGSMPVYVVVLTVVAGWWWRRGQHRITVFVATTVMGGSLLNTLAKLMFNRARPMLPDPLVLTSGLNFPSGHAQAAVVNCSVVLIVFWRLLHTAGRSVALAVATMLVLGIGVSRVTLGVHFVSDVLAGYVLGGAWTLTMTIFFWPRGHGPSA
ncbi:phosphatase PAP2 family protein [Nonomuraea endophytica]|uniref:phosphatase PAP2 family protein n=1 Tax=Nonomuraea endophytica TaxID=714136 RepID=UPI0037C7B5C4